MYLMNGDFRILPRGGILRSGCVVTLRLPCDLLDHLFHISQRLFSFCKGGTSSLQPVGKPLDLLVFDSSFQSIFRTGCGSRPNLTVSSVANEATYIFLSHDASEQYNQFLEPRLKVNTVQIYAVE